MNRKLHESLEAYKDTIYITITLLLVGISIASRLSFNGSMFGFDYYLYQPDGAAYTYMALKLTGTSHEIAAREVITWYSLYAEPGSNFSKEFFNADSNPAVWGLVTTRIVYPLLSAPFVGILGIPGMLAIPVISFVLFLYLILWLGKATSNRTLAYLLVVLISISPTILRWYVANITDGLLATIISIAFVVILRFREQPWSWFLLSFLVVLGSFTRFSLPYWLALSVILMILGKLKLGLFLSVISVVSFVPSLQSMVEVRDKADAFLPVVTGSTLEKVLLLPWSAIRVLFFEFAQLAAIDRLLLILILGAALLSLLHFKALSSRFFLLVSLAGWSIGTLNGTIGVNFRYQLPIIFFACFVLLDRSNFLVSLRPFDKFSPNKAV